MTRGASTALLPDRVDRHPSKHPQPVLDTLLPAGVNEGTISSHSHSHSSSERPLSASTSSFPTTTHHGDSDSEDDGLHIPHLSLSRGKPPFQRARSDLSKPSLARSRRSEDGKEAKFRMRHGWEKQLDSPEQAHLLSQTFFMYYEDKRHETAGNPPSDFDPKHLVSEWRMKDRLKTVSAILAVCLNVGVDPPDVVKPKLCANLECWVDPKPSDNSTQSSTSNSNAQIGKNLQSQYENLSLRMRYKVIIDPSIEELKKYTTSLRRTAHAERLLFHYNGHGVPKPTQSREIWCFNRSYTQYIPISLYDLQEWFGAPGLWVWDCSASGGIIDGFKEAAEKHSANQQEALRRDPTRSQQQPLVRWEDHIHLAACKENEVLPTNPDLPADLLTSCLTTPIAMAVRFFILQNPLPSTSGVTLAQARDIPGKITERRTPLGELNWIFTAITDTIAWNCLDKPLFKKLFRQDLMVAALFRNLLLAQRVMRIYHCHPQSHPPIPDTHNHPLWQSWDLAVEIILAQLPKLIEQQKANDAAFDAVPNGAPPPPPQRELEYVHSDFFADQLSAFEVYLSSAPANSGAQGFAKPPEQLPIVLQVLLSQVHRLRALILLSKFLDLGPWAVNLALTIGIFPYVLKLLQSQAIELKPPMVFIWARILAVDQSCQDDLLKDAGYTYFTNILNSATGIPLGNVAEHRAMCAFVIAMFCKDFAPGKAAVLESNPEIIESCLAHLLDMENPLLRQFSCLCLSHLWQDYPLAKAAGLAHQAHARVRDRSHDPVPEVRAACLDALTSFIGTGEADTAVLLEEETLASVVVAMGMDGSIMVRKELVVFYSTFIKKYECRFIVSAWEQLNEDRDKKMGKDEDEGGLNGVEKLEGANGDAWQGRVRQAYGAPNGVQVDHERGESSSNADSSAPEPARKVARLLSKKTIYRAIWRQTLSMSADPHREVAQRAQQVVDYLINALLNSPLGEHAYQLLDELFLHSLKTEQVNTTDKFSRQRSVDQRPQTPPSPATSTASKTDGYFGLSRAASIKNIFGWGQRPEQATPPSPTRSHRDSISASLPYRSRPLTPHDASLLPQDPSTLPPDALDTVNGPPHQGKAKEPLPPNFKARDESKMPELPLTSKFFTWSSSYFREPQMRPSEEDEPGSLNYNERLWRRTRNDKIIASTQTLKEAAGSQAWDVPCGYFGIGAAPHKMVFHQFENHLITSDDRDSIAVWDWTEARQLNRFSNGNPARSRVTELRFINEDDQAMLMTGSSDGVIKIFKHYDDFNKMELASSFRALSELVSSDTQSAGLVFDWQQGQGRILVAGDDRVIRVWQAGHELCITDIPARSGSCITSLTSDQVEGNIFVAGYGNGSVRAFDQRLSSRDSMIMDWVDRKADHRSWIVGARLQRGGMRELVSAESNGGIRLWDIRMRKAVNGIDGKKEPRNLRSLSVHEHAPVLATGSADHTIRVYNTSLKHICSFEPYMSYLRMTSLPRTAPITATAFHPHRMMLACGAVNDGHVNLFKCEATAEERSGVVDEWNELRA